MLKSRNLSISFVGWDTFSNFNFNMLLILGLAVVNILYKVNFSFDGIYLASNLWSPTVLLLAPLLYFSVRINAGLKTKYIGWHLLPFFFFLVFYGVAFYNSAKNVYLYEMYQKASFALPLSFLGYVVRILRARKGYKPADEVKSELLILIFVTFLIIGIVTTLIYLCDILAIDMGINYHFFTYGLLSITTIFILRYFFWPTKDSPRSAPAGVPSYANSLLSDEKVNTYLQQIHQYFEASEAFLRPDLSLHILAEELDIPKHYFSQLFNVHIGKSFYQYVAEYRVTYAIKRMQEGGIKLKIESLAYECGFNSKTSFNKYFKSIVGCTPIEYLNQKDSEAPDQVSSLVDSE